eukprot:5201543-Amphidinium_carterae.1
MRVICRYCGMVAPYSIHGRLASMHESCRSALVNCSSLHTSIAQTVPGPASQSECLAPSGSSGSRDIVPPAVTSTQPSPHATGRRRFT